MKRTGCDLRLTAVSSARTCWGLVSHLSVRLIVFGNLKCIYVVASCLNVCLFSVR